MKHRQKCQCPSCGAFSVLEYDGILECCECRHLFTDDAPLDLGYLGSLRSTEPASYAPQSSTEPTDARYATIRSFRTCCGVSEEVEVVVEEYALGGHALQLWDDQGPLLTATVWVPGIPKGCVAVKDYSENEGCLAQLIQHRIVSPPVQFLEGLPVCRLLLGTSSTAESSPAPSPQASRCHE